MKEKNKFGQYFTIDPIAEFMVNLINHKKDCSVLEPSCGKGVFLSKLEEKGFHNISAYEIDENLKTPYPYVKYESFISSPLDCYDVIIGNPPYIRWKNLEQELKSELASSVLWNNYFNSLCDYLFIFVLKSIEQLNNEGELIFICSDYWLNTTHSLSLRNYMVQNGYFSEIYHFKEAPLFDGVNASLMIFRYVKTQKKANSIKLYQYINDRKFPNLDDLYAKKCFELSIIPNFKEDERWILATDEQQDRLKKFELACQQEYHTSLWNRDSLYRIGDFCDIGNGMVSGLDKAFNLTQIASSLNELEKTNTIKVLKAKDLVQYSHSSESIYFFIQNRISETEFKYKYPNVYEHLNKYKDELNKRYNYGKEIPYWEFVFPRSKALFLREEKRIFVPCKERISNKDYFRFSLVGKDFMPLQDVTGIFKKDSCKESIEYITAYLNSEYVFEWLKYNGIIKGYIVEFSETPIASIPYRPIDWNNPKEIALHNEISKYVINFVESKEESIIPKIKHCFNILFS